jgi:hypothetical protein
VSYSERIRHPSGALNPPKKSSRVNWWWFVLAGVAAFILIAIFRPQWLAKIGVQLNLSDASKALAGIANPRGWVG